MSSKTVSEFAFEKFCSSNGFSYQKIVEGSDPTPDYVLTINDMTIYVEVKQIDEDVNFSSARQTRSPGTHIRAKINEARNQVRNASENGFPTVLLVYNNLDPLQRFGTEQHDFHAAMYGELTMLVSVTPNSSSGVFHGRNRTFRENKNNSFSAVGRLYKDQDSVAVHLYENMYAKVPLNYGALPPAMQYNRDETQVDGDV